MLNNIIRSNLAWLVIDKLIRLSISLFVGASVARYLGPERFGQLSYVLTFVTIFQGISLLGLDSIVVRNLVAEPELAHVNLGTALVLRLVGSIVTYTVMILVGLIINNDPQLTLALTVIIGASIFLQVADLIDLWFQSQLQNHRVVLAKSVSFVLIAGFKIAIVLTKGSLLAFAVANVLETGINAVALMLWYWRFPTTKKWKWSSSKALALIRQSWPLLLSGVSILVYMRIGTMFLRNIKGDLEVGIYTAGATLSEMWYFVPMTLATVIGPMVARSRSMSPHNYRQLIHGLFAGMWLLSITVSVANFVVAKYIVSFLYGNRFSGAATVFAVHSLTFVPVSIGVMQSIWIVNENRANIAVLQAISGSFVSICLNPILIAKYGALGVSITALTSQFTQAFLINFIVAPDLFKLQAQSLIRMKSDLRNMLKNLNENTVKCLHTNFK